jgi:hypothetical protein
MRLLYQQHSRGPSDQREQEQQKRRSKLNIFIPYSDDKLNDGNSLTSRGENGDHYNEIKKQLTIFVIRDSKTIHPNLSLHANI